MEGVVAELTMLGKIIFSVLLGGIVGFEREIKGKPAGLRTHMLVVAASCGLVQFGVFVITNVEGRSIEADTVGVLQAIIVGVAFIGGGVVSVGQGEVKNLTTAASIFFAATIGCAIGLNLFVVGIGMTLINIIVNASLLVIQRRMHDKDSKDKEK